MSRPRGWLGDWRPQRKTLLLIEQIQVVLQEYAAHLPLTVRQIFYRLVGAYGYDKTELAYDRLGEVAARGTYDKHFHPQIPLPNRAATRVI